MKTDSRIQRVGIFAARLLVLAVLLFAGRLLASPPSSTQSITLAPGWNLISIQVGVGPLAVESFRSALSDPTRLVEVWGYEPTGNPAAPGAWRTYQPVVTAFPSDLAIMELGRGYWVNVSQATTLTLNGIPWDGTVSLVKGWNLVGFPGLALGTTEVVDLASVFGAGFDRIQQVWTFDTSLQRFSGFDLTAVPVLRELTNVRPGRGYWVYSISDTALSLQPAPFVALPADSDASPPQGLEPFQATDPRWLGSNANPYPSRPTYVGRQVRFRATDGSDSPYDLNANGLVDDPETQDTILFEKSGDTVSITIGNKGTGVLNWTLENPVPWLFTAPADDRTWPEGITSRPRGAAGTVASDKDVLLLYVDRSGMSPGRVSGDVTLWAGGQAFPIRVLVDVAPVDGDWRGFATTTRVGGRNISLGEVRLVLNSFSVGGNEANGFRAVLNREQSILFPRDVYMDGVFYAANQFKLTTNFEMKAGDRNAPPYNVFPGDAKDRDVNGDGKVDVMNPFPFGIRREVTLLGTRVSPNRLEGTYIESIRGMLPPLSANTLVTNQNQFLSDSFLTTSQPVFIEGTFVLERQSFTPTKRSVFNESADLGLNIGGSDTTNRSVTFDVTTPVTVQGVTLSLNLTFPDPALLQISLIGPNPNDNPYVVHEFGDDSAVPTSVVLPANAFTGAGNGTWTLVVEWDGSTGERGNLASWGLNIEGASTHQATGRIVASGLPVAGASIRLEGGVTTQTFASAANGTFTIPALTENDYTLFISKPGYQSTSFTFFIGENDETLGDIAITPLPITAPQLKAAPPIGFAGTQPLHVEFTVDLPLNFGGTSIAWDFDGNGTAEQSGSLAALTEVAHDYLTPGVYLAKATLSGGTLGAPVELTQLVHVHRGSADPSGGSRQVLVNAFVGSFGARADAGANSTSAPPAGVTDTVEDTVNYLGPAPVELKSGFVFQESIWDMASFDQDRIPFAPGAVFPGPEDLDFTPNHPALRYVRFNTNSPNPSKYETLLYSATPSGSKAVEAANAAGFTDYSIPSGTSKPNRFRIGSAIGGAVFATGPASVGNLQIHPGRTIP